MHVCAHGFGCICTCTLTCLPMHECVCACVRVCELMDECVCVWMFQLCVCVCVCVDSECVLRYHSKGIAGCCEAEISVKI